MKDNTKQKSIAHLLGVGLDNEDGHKRITRAEEFSIVGGSEETHDRMTETVLKTMEDLQKKGKQLADAEVEELGEMLHRNTPR